MPSFTEVLDRYVDLIEGSKILKIHRESLRRLIKKRKLEGKYLKFRGKYLIDREELLKFKETYESRVGPKRKIKRLL